MLKKLLICFTLLTSLFSATYAEEITMIILQTSLKKEGSRSDLLGDILFEKAKKAGFKVEKISLKEFPLPICDGDGGAAYDQPQVKIIHDKIKAAKVILVAFPIHNYSVAASTKNLFELTTHSHKDILKGDAWRGKVVGLAAAAGSANSMLAPLSFISTLIVDQRCVVIPHYAVATGDDFKDKDPTKTLNDRLDKMIEQAKTLGAAV